MTFRPAQRAEAKPLIGLYSESGCGKTWSSLLLARGYAGPAGRIGMIETEGGRGEAYVGRSPVGDYLVRPIRGHFAPAEYGAAIADAEKARLDALIVDSASHEWEGAGGVLSMAAENQAKGIKGVLVWQKPKLDHQRHFMLRLMQTPIPLVIVCMRAKYPMIEQRNAKGEREWVRATALEPKQADDILFEMFVHGWIDREHRLHVSKYTLPELAQVIRDGEPVTLETGRALARWASGGGEAPPLGNTAERPAGAAATRHDRDQPRPAVGAVPSAEDYVARWELLLEDATPETVAALAMQWNAERALRADIAWPGDDSYARLRAAVVGRIDALKAAAAAQETPAS